MSTKFVEVSNTNLPLDVLVDDGRTGLSGTVAIREATNYTGVWLDFNDLTFKDSGWVTRTAALTEIDPTLSPGLYNLFGGLDISLITNLPDVGSELIAEFYLSGVHPPFNGYAIDSFVLVNNVYDLPTAEYVSDVVWDEDITSHTAANSSGLELQNKSETGDVMSISPAQISEIASNLLDTSLSGHFLYDSVGEALTIIKGLVQQNYMVDQTSYNAAGLMTSARFRIFKDSIDISNATEGGTGEGEIATFIVEAGGSGTQLRFYKVKRS